MLLTITCFISVMFGLAQAQAIKIGFSGPISSYISVTLLPGMALSLYGLSTIFGWWTIGIFLILSIAVGVFHGYATRSAGRVYLLNMQPIYAIGFLLSSVACGVLLFVL